MIDSSQGNNHTDNVISGRVEKREVLVSCCYVISGGTEGSLTGVLVIITSECLQRIFSARMLITSISTSRKPDSVTTVTTRHFLLLSPAPYSLLSLIFHENSLQSGSVDVK